MAYTPINWQTGQTITAEKLNKMDNGWSVESSSSQLFSETVTTVDGGAFISAAFQYAGIINYDAIIVVFNGQSYVCPKIEAFGGFYYGGFTQSGPDFSEYPFAIESYPDNGNSIYTETAGTYTVEVDAVAKTVEVGDDFAQAVQSVPMSGTPFMMTVGETTHDEYIAARVAGRPCFCGHTGVMVFVGWETTNGDTYDLTIAPIPGAFTLRFNSSGILEAVIS